MKDKELKLRDLHASHTLCCVGDWNIDSEVLTFDLVPKKKKDEQFLHSTNNAQNHVQTFGVVQGHASNTTAFIVCQPQLCQQAVLADLRFVLLAELRFLTGQLSVKVGGLREKGRQRNIYLKEPGTVHSQELNVTGRTAGLRCQGAHRSTGCYDPSNYQTRILIMPPHTGGTYANIHPYVMKTPDLHGAV